LKLLKPIFRFHYILLLLLILFKFQVNISSGKKATTQLFIKKGKIMDSSLSVLAQSYSGSSSSGSVIGVIVILVIGFALYFLPSIIGFARKKSNSGAIFVLNLLLGWIFVGWVISLVWALTKDQKPVVPVVMVMPTYPGYQAYPNYPPSMSPVQNRPYLSSPPPALPPNQQQPYASGQVPYNQPPAQSNLNGQPPNPWK
jgi:hypothetical protein